ncbi:MAG: helix-turn-helix domain-containing protein [Saprospiraceae bacterium]|nr:helix-turn-helix domain-containing protein [Saprospiraceae bacterium]
MASIKKYQSVHPDNLLISFDIKRMEHVYEIRASKPDAPHRHDYYTVLLIAEAKGKHLVDFQEFELKNQQVYFVSPGQVHQIVEEQKSIGYVLTFSRQFMLENGIESDFIEALHLFQDFGYSPPLEPEKAEFEALQKLAESIIEFNQSNKKFKEQAVGALVKLFLIQCNNFCSLSREENTQTAQAAVSLLRSFKQLLDIHFSEWHKVSAYAEALHITADYLNTSIKSLSGKSAKEHIQSRIIVAAKRLLRFSELQNKEIAYQLGFSEAANFSQFFKKCTGMSPSQFRSQ